MLSSQRGLTKLLTVGMLALGMLGGATGWATTFYVSPDGDDSDGSSWSKAKKTIQGGYDVAVTEGDEVIVNDGAYMLAGTINVSRGITIKSRNNRDVTIVNGGGSNRCFWLNSASAVIDGFTITNGYPGQYDSGAGVYIQNGTVRNCTISGNGNSFDGETQCGGGGGINIDAGVVSNCVIVGNTAKQNGAGININGGTVRDCTISDNIISGNGAGGGVRITSGTLRGCGISNNSAGWAGGISCEGGTVSNCTISGNVSSGEAGGARVSGGTVRDCTISGNSAASGGGVSVGNNGGTVWNCTISGNWGTQPSGAGVNNGSGGTIKNCLIIGNYSESSQSWGGSGSVVQNGGTMESCTIVGNSGPVYVSQGPWDNQQWYSVFNQDGATLKNCIVVNNTPGFGNTGTKCTYSCTAPLVSGTGNIMQDPQFVDPGSGVGASFIPGHYQLGAYSPCIDAGTNVTSWMSTAKDLAGNARIIRTTVDMGAYECALDPATRIAAPTNVAASDGLFGDKVRVTWSPVAGAIGYVVYRGSDISNVNFSTFWPATNSPYNDTNAAPGSNYYYWVAASDAQGRSELSAGDQGYVSLYGVNFDGAQVVFLDGDKHLKKISTNGIISDVFRGTNPAVDQIIFNRQGDLFIAFPQSMGGPGGQGGVVLNDGYSFILARATPTNNALIGVDHEILQLVDWGSWWNNGQMASPNLQVDEAGNAYYYGITTWGGPGAGPEVALRKYFNGTTNIVNLIPGDNNVQLYNWNVMKDGTVLYSGRTISTSSDWFKKISPQNKVAHIISPPVRTLFVATFPDELVYVGIESWTKEGADYNCPGVYRLPPDISNPNFAFPYIGDANWWNQSGQQIFTPEYDVRAVLAGHIPNENDIWSNPFGRQKGTRITQWVTTSDKKVFVLAADWQGGKMLLQYYPTVEVIDLENIEMVSLIAALGDKLVISGTLGTQQKLILYDNGYEDDLIPDDNIEIFHMQTMYTGHIWFDGLRFSDNQYIAGRFTFAVEYGANGKTSLRAPKGGMDIGVTLGDQPGAFIGLLPSTISTVVTPTAAPSAPEGLKASQGIYSDRVKVAWRTAANATSYEVYRNTSDNSASAPKLGDADTVGYEDTTAKVGVIYYYWVKAVNAIGASGFSASGSGWANGRNIAADFDGDGKADPAMMDSDGNWYVWSSLSGYQRGGPYPLAKGLTGTPVAADFDGDGKADPALMDGSGQWYIWYSGSGYGRNGPYNLGLGAGYTALAADFDGDGLADPTMVNASGNWGIFLSGQGYCVISALFAIPGGTPLAGDFDGDGRADPVMVAAGNWNIYFSGSGYTKSSPYPLNVLGGSPVAGDIDGDRLADPVMVSAGNWYIWFSGSRYAKRGPYPLRMP